MPDTIIAPQTPANTASAGTPNTPAGQQPVVNTPQGSGTELQGQPKPTAEPKAGADQAIEYSEFTLPEGIEPNKELQAAFVPIAKELKLSQDQAQKLVTLQAESEIKRAQAQETAWEEVNAAWTKQAKEDKEIGGVKFEENTKLARQALESLVPDKVELKQLDEDMALTGMGNHPVLVKILVKVAKRMGEDIMPNSGRGGGEGPRDPAKILFPTMN